MSFQASKNVWGKLNKSSERHSLQANFKVEGQKGAGHGYSQLGQGPFGSKNMFGSCSGPKSLPEESFQRKNSRLFRFELGNCSSDSSCSSTAPSSGPNSIIGFGMEPKKYNWGVKTDQAMDWASGGSSKASSGFGSRTNINLGKMVDKVFCDEIGKMAENLQRGSCLWK